MLVWYSWVGDNSGKSSGLLILCFDLSSAIDDISFNLSQENDMKRILLSFGLSTELIFHLWYDTIRIFS